MVAYSIIGCGILSKERLYWQSFSLEELRSLYMAINATPGKVLALFQLREGFLITYISP